MKKSNTIMKFTKKQLSQHVLDAFTTKYNSADTVYSLEEAGLKRKVQTFSKSVDLTDDEVKEQSILFSKKCYERIFPQINLQYFKDLVSEEMVEKAEDDRLEEKELLEYTEATINEVIKFCFNQTMKIMRKERRRNRNK
jgi:hypothetical protein